MRSHFATVATAILLFIWLCPGQAVHGHGHGGRWRTEPIRERRDVACDTSYAYRSYDGSCNNLVNTEYGMAGTPFRRILPAKYENNDNQTPRLTGSSGATLPSARSVSTIVHNARNRTIRRSNHMVMQWAQFLDHDLTHTPTVPDISSCCSSDLVTSGNLHPNVTTGGPCFPIIIGPRDRFFDTLETRCMEFIRSDPVIDSNGVRQQYNAITAWLDGSQVYGHNEALANSLRSFVDGKMAVKTVDGEDFLPEDTDAKNTTCFKLEANDYCFLAGDVRANVYPGLTALHTIFVRYHNQICDRLKGISTRAWTDESLYQEARRIVVAVLQRITYGNFMTEMLGAQTAARLNLLFSDPEYAYDSSVDPTLSNVFSTAAFRFGHSMISDSLTIGNVLYETGELFLRPKFVLNSIKDVLEAIISEVSQQTDRWYTTGMTNRMFELPDKPKSGSDIAARNIQRGRDHGLPSYNDWREHYDLPRRRNFDELGRSGRVFQRVFNSVDDIDLYSGAINELPTDGAKVGELYLLILSQQFRDLKFGDRFWFENLGDSTVSFTAQQLTQFGVMTLAKVICETVPQITQIQANVFRQDHRSNPLVSCSSLPDIDIETFWA